MKKIEIIRQLGQNLRQQNTTILELEILLAIWQGINQISMIIKHTGAKEETVRHYIKSMKRRGEIKRESEDVKTRRTIYSLEADGARILLACITIEKSNTPETQTT